MRVVNSIFPFLAWMSFSAFLSSCAADRYAGFETPVIGKRDETSFYQNFTSRYNTLYHAHLLLMDEQARIVQQRSQDYRSRQVVFHEPEPFQPTNIAMDSVIGKAYTIIQEKKESKYLNEAYYTLAKAHYLKGSYYTAIGFFNYVIEHASSTHYRPLAYAWRSRAQHQLKKHAEGGRSIDSALALLDNDSKRISHFLYAAKANSLLYLGDETEAATYLKDAIAGSKRIKEHRHWEYLLAQLCASNGESVKAQHHFTRVANANVPYELAFEAELQQKLLETDGIASIDSKTKILKRMLRKGKNERYRDRILYQMGRLHLNAEEHQQAIHLFNQSLRYTSLDLGQATDTYLALATHYIDSKRYQQAQLYYDSVAMILPSQHPNARSIQRRLAHMPEFTRVGEQVIWQDTLLYLASLHERERDDRIVQYTLQHRDEHAETKKKGPRRNKDKNANIAMRSTPLQTTHYADERFYFNNPDAMATGNATFRRRWGNRILLDDWRYTPTERAITPLNSMHASQITLPELNGAALAAENSKERYLSAIPLTPQAVETMRQEVHDGLLTMANILTEEIRDPQAATRIYEDFVVRFPHSENLPVVYYALHHLYSDLSEENKAQLAKETLISRFPTSDAAMVLADPDYWSKWTQEKNQLDKAFSMIYSLFEEKKYADVISAAEEVLTGEYSPVGPLAQISYLQALSIGYLNSSLEPFVDALSSIIRRYPEDKLVTPLALEQLRFITENTEIFANRETALLPIDDKRLAFEGQPYRTPWPEWKPTKRQERAAPAIGSQDSNAEDTERIATKGLYDIFALDPVRLKMERQVLTQNPILNRQNTPSPTSSISQKPNEYRSVDLFPDSTAYFFVIHVANGTVNLAPSRYGIGQFNRSRYAREGITHQLRKVGDQDQLLYIGPLTSYQDALGYQGDIQQLLTQIMKIPQENYGIFVITKALFETLTDRSKIEDYYEVYLDEL